MGRVPALRHRAPARPGRRRSITSGLRQSAMMLDAQDLAEFAAKTLEELEGDAFLPDGARLSDAHLVVEVSGVDEDGDTVSWVQGFTMSGRNVAGVGLLVRSLAAALQL